MAQDATYDDSPRRSREEERRKKRSLVDNFDSVRSTVKTIRTVVNIARYIVNPTVVWIIVGVIVFIIIYMLFFGGSGSPFPFGGRDPSPTPAPGSETIYPPIPGLTIQISGPEVRENGETITYPITITYDESVGQIPPEEIIVFDILPANTELEGATPPYRINGNTVEWTLSDILSISNLSITIRPTAENITISNKVSARTTRSIPSGGLSSNICTQPHEAGGYCSVDNLKQYFGGDTAKATTASLICNLESGGDPFLINQNCGTNDYSVGLFQINLVAHCPGAYANLNCNNLIDANKRLACSQQMLDPVQNIQKMVSLSGGGTSWQHWSTWPATQNILSTCSATL